MAGCSGDHLSSQLYGKAQIGRRQYRLVPGTTEDPIRKTANIKKAEGVVQVVEYLPSKTEVPSSTPPVLSEKTKAFLLQRTIEAV
jgi:hypothetical protein